VDPVKYILNLQRVFIVLAGLSFASLSAVLVFLNPYQNSLYIWLFLVIFLILLTSSIALLAFWWFFTFRKVFLSVVQANQIVYQSLFTSATAVFVLVLNQVGQLNLITTIMLLVVYIFYWLWANSEQ
jgi:hypothetical protein